MKLFSTLVLIVPLTVCVITESSPQDDKDKKIPSISRSNEETGLKIPKKTRKNPERKGDRTFWHPHPHWHPHPVTPPPVHPPIVTWKPPTCR